MTEEDTVYIIKKESKAQTLKSVKVLSAEVKADISERIP